MTTTTVILLNGILSVCLLAALALVMYVGHRAAGPKTAGAANWSSPLEPERALTFADPELDRAA